MLTKVKFITTTLGPRISVPGPGNLLTQPNDFSSAAWVKSACTATANSVLSPDGTLTADTITNSATTNRHGLYATVAGQTANIAQLLAFRVKKGTVRYISIGQWNGANNNSCGAGFDLDALVVTGVGAIGTGYSASTPKIARAGRGFFVVSVICVTPATTNYPAFIHRNTAYSSGMIEESFLGSTADLSYLWGAELRPV